MIFNTLDMEDMWLLKERGEKLEEDQWDPLTDEEEEMDEFQFFLIFFYFCLNWEELQDDWEDHCLVDVKITIVLQNVDHLPDNIAPMIHIAFQSVNNFFKSI